MGREREEKIRQHRLRQPLEELERKSAKARRPGWWTQEDIDAAKAEAAQMVVFFQTKDAIGQSESVG